MSGSLNLGGAPSQPPRIRRLNRLPVVIAIALAVVFFGVIVYGLSTRGMRWADRGLEAGSNSPPASSFRDQLKAGVRDGIIGAPQEVTPPPPTERPAEAHPPSPPPVPTPPRTAGTSQALEPEEAWRARLLREQEEQYIRERQRQRMAQLQADHAAYDSPITVDIKGAQASVARPGPNGAAIASTGSPASSSDLYTAALKGGLGGAVDPNGQNAKETFFNQDLKQVGYLPNQVVTQTSRFELKRGSVIPATLITGINSDLPGRITAQVSQNVYDSATGHCLLIPQGTKLLGKYDSKVSFGQSRVLVVWTDIIFPNGSTLQIGNMAGTDAAGYGGFNDEVDNKYFQTFGSAILVALIGAGINAATPQSNNPFNSTNSAQFAAQQSFVETFGRFAQETISKNLNVQPTLQIRPGYQFNVLVDQDIVFPASY
ncbi:IncP-type conjugal transfer protein TrbI [Xanthobacter sp. DSM 24535]|uniref:Type IV secretion system protein VirB10 n=1 Tax=Aquabacter spiritensis TaxID=933073 RepID=A0A4R3LN57_9HYPH|nr:IncP-type conjugal transfer protein TrbI [Aquabacter spiritensis]TCT01863.1 type IV secretion system protein VirB10 [Aquabacter spiritensis]